MKANWNKLLNDPVFQRVLADARSIQNRFAAEPAYAKTGKGFLKSAGVEALKKIKAAAFEADSGAGE